MNKIRISNDRLWEIAEQGQSIDQWLKDTVGIGNWKEYFGVTQLPYRSFSFTNPKDEVLFILRWS